MGASQKYSLRWNDFNLNVASTFRDLHVRQVRRMVMMVGMMVMVMMVMVIMILVIMVRMICIET